MRFLTGVLETRTSIMKKSQTNLSFSLLHLRRTLETVMTPSNHRPNLHLHHHPTTQSLETSSQILYQDSNRECKRSSLLLYQNCWNKIYFN
ncbi:hypothetical protein LXL04_034993 [Taraxacum kok-saghyz]